MKLVKKGKKNFISKEEKLIAISAISILFSTAYKHNEDKLTKVNASTNFNDIYIQVSELKLYNKQLDQIDKGIINLDDSNIIQAAGKIVIIEKEVEDERFRLAYTYPSDEELIAFEDGVYHEIIDNTPEEQRNPLDFRDTYEMTAFYSKVFELDVDTVYSKLIELSNQNWYKWNYQNILCGYKYKTKEEAIARLVCDINNNPEDYGLSQSQIKSSNGYELNEYITEELVYKFCDVLGVNPNIAMAIGYTESGRNLSSGLYIHRHNIGGVMGSHGFAKYKNEATGLFLFVKMLKDKYDVNIDSGNDKVNSMARRYCPDGGQWQSMVKNIKSELENNGFDYNYRRYNYEGRDLYLIGIYDPQTQVDDVSRVRSD